MSQPETVAPPQEVDTRCDKIRLWLSRLTGAVFFVIFAYVLFVIIHVLRVDCPFENGRRCNGRGVCSDGGLCECQPLYSGVSCGNTLVPGYLPETNQQCNGNGFANPFIEIPTVCQAEFKKGVYQTGTGWINPACVAYVAQAQAVLSTSLPELNPALASTIPLCFCYPGFVGQACLQSGCPTDSIARNCGGNGNTSVGLIQNYTRAGSGCQCTNVVALYEPQYRAVFTTEALDEIQTFYDTDFNYRVYCGRVYSILAPNGTTIPNRLIFSSNPSDYKCYCGQDWAGRACTVGKCPYNPNTGKFCNGNGAEHLGQGVLTNVTARNTTNGPCNIICKDGWERCFNFPDRCIYSQSPYEQLFDPGVLCQTLLQCPDDAPLRAYTGGCYRLPPDTGGLAQNCFNGFQEAVIDYAQFNQSVLLWKCPNITDFNFFSDCFLNRTALGGILEYSQLNGGGVFINTTVPVSWAIDLGSPLLYFQFESTGPVRVVNWDGQVFDFSTAGFHSQSINYNQEGEWIQREIQAPINLLRLTEDLYQIYPIQIFNYSILQLFDPNVTYIKIVNSERQVTYVLDSVNSNVEVIAYAPGLSGTYPNIGLLLRSPFNSATEVDEQWYFPSTGDLLSRAACLGNAAQCAWVYNETTGKVYNQERTLWVCNTTTYLSDEECPYDFDDYYLQVDSFRWYTSVQARSRIPVTALVAQFDILQTNLSEPFRFTGFQLLFNNVSSNETFFTAPSFLTKDRTRYECIVPPSSLDQNQSTLNEEWWSESVKRAVTLSRVDLQSDFFLGAVFSQGEKRLYRSKAISVNDAAQTMILRDVVSGLVYSAHVRDVRTLARLEVLRGWPQADTLIQPFRCPDGTATSMSSTQRELAVSCNMTEALPIVVANCTDEMGLSWGCECDLDTPECLCGEPATYFFQQHLLERIEALRTCECLFFTPSLADLVNSSVTVQGINATVRVFVQGLNQIPTNLIFTTNGSSSCDINLVNITQGSVLFSNLTPQVEITGSVDDLGGGSCEYWITLNPDQFLASTNLGLTLNDGGLIDWATVLFSTYGIGLMHTSDIPQFTASSNSDDAPNVNILNSSYWLSSGSLREYPVWIKASYEYQHFVTMMRIVFYEAGTIHGAGTEIPLQVQIQGFNSMGWTSLAQFGVYVVSGGWKEVLIDISTGNLTFSEFRLVAPGGRMGIRQWEIYTNQDCYCGNGTWLSINLQSTAGLIDLTQTLEDIDFFFANVAQENCVCVDDCQIEFPPGEFRNVSQDGKCQDVLFTNSKNGINETPLEEVENENVTFAATEGTLEILFTWELSSGRSSVQFSNDSAEFMNRSTQLSYVDTSLVLSTGQFIPSGFSANENSYFFLLNTSTLEVLYTTFRFVDVNVTRAFYFNGTFTFSNLGYDYNWGPFLAGGGACAIGHDCTDCGPVRSAPFLPGYTCFLTPFQQMVLTHLTNGNMLLNRTYYLANLTQLEDPWFASFQNVNLTRTQVQVTLNDCEEQVCTDPDLPVLCGNGTCVEFPSDCEDRFNCPGNGCVELTDGALNEGKVYQCACKVGFNGDACEFGRCLAATPLLSLEQGGVPPGEECSVDPPLTQVTSGVNLRTFQDITNAEIEIINNRITGIVAPRSSLDIGPHNVKALHNPFGRKIRRKVVKEVPGFAPTVYWTTCDYYRKGTNGAKYRLIDDVISRNSTTGNVTRWRSEIVNGVNVTYQWFNLSTYDDFSWRCSNGICVENQNYCKQSLAQFKLCNGRGWGRADGSCECYPGWKTFSINTDISNKIAVPYPVINNVSEPTLMVLDDTWRHWSLTQCTARDCEAQDCQNLKGCYSGTSEVGFVDRLVPCTQNTGRFGFCAPSLQQCISGIGLQAALECSGNGIPRIKDITGERYCYCGNPISQLQNVSAVSQITQLKSNGWGGPTCSDPFAPDAPLVWSKYNYELDTPWRSLVTGEVLPGVWLSGIAPAGPSPDDILLLRQCCPTGRLEACNCVPCRVDSDRGRIQLLEPDECLIVGVPLIYRCNNHGVARGDGTCDCDIDENDGSGYTYDLNQFSVKGCFKFVQCPISPVNNVPCHKIDPLNSPGEWLHPLPKDDFLEQQWLTCGLEGQGMLSNITKIESITTNLVDYGDLIQQSLANVALEVIEAINGLSGCICVYPNDTQTEKCCMVENDVELQYEQNFNSPYLLSARVIGIPELTDGSLEALRTIAFSETVTDNIVVRLDVRNETYLSAIRMFSTAPNGTVVSVVNSLGDIVCADAAIQGNDGVYFDWNYGEDQGASQCGPTYTCQNTRLFADYDANCEFDKQSTRCLEWKRSQCIAENVNNVYWPPDSLNTYLGCNRNMTDPDGCQCCQRDVLSQLDPVLSDGVVNFTITSGGPVYINQIQIYGYTNRSLTPPSFLQDLVNTISGTEDSACHDEIYFRGNLGPDRGYYIPLDTTPGSGLVETQRPRTRENAQIRCNETGGWLAVTDNTVDQDDVETLSNMCGQLSQTGVCMVAARDPVNIPSLVGRPELFSDTCTPEYGCYVPQRVGDFNLLSPNQFEIMTFSNYDPTNLTYNSSPIFTDQWPASEVPSVIYSYNTAGTSCNLELSSDGLNWVNAATVTYMADFGYGINLVTGRLSSGQTFNNWKALRLVPTGCAVLALHIGSAVRAPEYMNSQANYNVNVGAPRVLLVPPGYDRTIINLFQESYVIYELSGVLTITQLVNAYFAKFGPSSDAYFLYALKIFPVQPAVVRYRVKKYYNDQTTGTIGVDYMIGASEFPYRPLFLEFIPDLVIDPIIGQTDFATVATYGFSISLTNQTVPVFIKKVNSETSFATCRNLTLCVVSAVGYVPLCTVCLNTLRGQIQWDDRLYSASTWKRSLSNYPTPELHLKGFLFTRSATFEFCPDPASCLISGDFCLCQQIVAPINNNVSSYIPISSLLVDYRTISATEVFNVNGQVAIFYSPQTYAHQISYIVSREERPSPPYVEWSINNCLVVNANASSQLEFCDEVVRNFICQYDYTKYIVVNGYQCPECGPSLGRVGGVPLPGRTCQEQFPLASAENFPFEHRVKDEYQRGTLALFADSFNIQPNITDDFRNTSVIWGFEQAWLKWKNCFSSQPGLTTRGVKANVNWCNLCPTLIWPFDCGTRVNPYTNIRERRLATSEEFCDPLLTNFTVAPMNNQTIPALVFPVLEANSYEDKTCGVVIPLRSYYRQDKFGAIQSDLALEQQIIKLQFGLVEVESTESGVPIKWFNAGKAPQPYTFQWDQTASIYGEYVLNNCPACPDALLEVFLHPLDPGYVPPTNVISVFVPITNTNPGETLLTYLVNYTVTTADTGILTVNGEDFPLVVFQGVGFRVHNITTGATFTLYNPVITNNETRFDCVNRSEPYWVEPLNAIKSTAPLRQCIISMTDQEEYPGTIAGECHCDLSTAGGSCSVPATISKFGKSGCGGYGQEGATVLAPDGQLYVTGELGGYVWNGHMDCKTFDLGRVAWTTIVPGAIWEYKSVYPPKAPRNGAPVFSQPPNRLQEQLTIDDVGLECEINQALVAYYYTSDELTQLLRLTENTYPVFMSVDTAAVSDSAFPWDSPISGALFSNDTTYTVIGDSGSCGSDIEVCAFVNFNNYVYGKGSVALLTDGDTVTSAGVAGNGVLNWFDSPPQQGTSVQVWVFLTAADAGTLITCTDGGSCDRLLGAGDSHYYNCNCATRSIDYLNAAYSEIQVFGLFDLSRSQFYTYF